MRTVASTHRMSGGGSNLRARVPHDDSCVVAELPPVRLWLHLQLVAGCQVGDGAVGGVVGGLVAGEVNLPGFCAG